MAYRISAQEMVNEKSVLRVASEVRAVIAVRMRFHALFLRGSHAFYVLEEDTYSEV